MLKLSVVMPVHNKAQYLERSINSVLVQTYSNFEFILVNDGSDDDSGIICDDFATRDPRITVVHKSNGGVSSARNVGIVTCNSEYIGFIDADDFWDQDFLMEICKMIDLYPDADIYSVKFARFSKNHVLKEEQFFSENEKYIVFDLISSFALKARYPINASSVVLRKSALLNVELFDEEIHVFEDYDLFTRLALFSKVVYLNTKVLSFYNMDVPVETKSRGVRPALNKHWIAHMSKFDDLINVNNHLRILLDRMRLSQLLMYRKKDDNFETFKHYFDKINKSSMNWKYKVIYNLPFWIGNFLIFMFRIYSKLRVNYFGMI